MTDMMQLALDSLREYEAGLRKMDGLHNVARLAEMRIAFAQALELRRIAVALETVATVVREADAADMTPHDLGE
jgi:hypothetical protein